MRKLFGKSSFCRWVVSFIFLGVLCALVISATFIVAALIGLRMDSSLQLASALGLHVLLCLPFWMLVFGFFGAPLLRQIGLLQYYSPFLIVSRAKEGVLQLHGGTPFDFFLRFDWQDRGSPVVQTTLYWYIQGLISLAREIESGHIPMDTQISGTSYFFSENSALRLGFTIERDWRHLIGGILTYPTQFLTYSFAKGRWALPRITQSKRASIDGAKLCSRIGHLERLQNRLQDCRGKAVACGQRA